VEAEERARTRAPREDDPSTEPPGERPADAEADGRAPIAHERCAHHSARQAVARCDACELPVCLACAVPVRGRVLGPECLAAELGDPALVAPPEPDDHPRGSWAVIAGAVAAVIGTAGPWTRTGAGDRLLGAWVPSLRWSMVAAVAAVALAISVSWLRARGGRRAVVTTTSLAAAVLAASVLAMAFPPTFQAASWGPWVTAVGGVLAIAALGANLVTERHPTQGV
jgi:hypothetical protein